jgi:hypothetical protein
MSVGHEEERAHRGQDEAEHQLFIVIEEGERNPVGAQARQTHQHHHVPDRRREQDQRDQDDLRDARGGRGHEDRDRQRARGNRDGEDERRQGHAVRRRRLPLVVVAAVRQVQEQVERADRDEGPAADPLEILGLEHLAFAPREEEPEAHRHRDVERPGPACHRHRLSRTPSARPADEDEAKPMARDRRVE